MVWKPKSWEMDRSARKGAVRKYGYLPPRSRRRIFLKGSNSRAFCMYAKPQNPLPTTMSSNSPFSGTMRYQRMNRYVIYSLILPEISRQVLSSTKQFLLMADVPVGDCFPGTGCPPLVAGSGEMIETTWCGSRALSARVLTWVVIVKDRRTQFICI